MSEEETAAERATKQLEDSAELAEIVDDIVRN